MILYNRSVYFTFIHIQIWYCVKLLQVNDRTCTNICFYIIQRHDLLKIHTFFQWQKMDLCPSTAFCHSMQHLWEGLAHLRTWPADGSMISLTTISFIQVQVACSKQTKTDKRWQHFRALIPERGLYVFVGIPRKFLWKNHVVMFSMKLKRTSRHHWFLKKQQQIWD